MFRTIQQGMGPSRPMLRIDPKYVAAARGATKGTDLHGLLRNAIQLEHATIPPYLTAAYSLHRNSNTAIFAALKEIAEEEMLHMAMVANVLNAIGGHPDIANPGFVPKYPGQLPMTIGSGLVVGLRKFSRQLVFDVFMEIEKPETPLHFPVIPFSTVAGAAFATIGQFYSAIIDKIKELGDPIFTGADPSRRLWSTNPVCGSGSSRFPT